VVPAALHPQPPLSCTSVPADPLSLAGPPSTVAPAAPSSPEEPPPPVWPSGPPLAPPPVPADPSPASSPPVPPLPPVPAASPASPDASIPASPSVESLPPWSEAASLVSALASASVVASVPPSDGGLQTPATHVPTEQGLPSGFSGFEQVPVAGSHSPAVWHWSLALQAIGLLPVHTPAWQESLCVHLLASSQGDPSAAAGLEHTPVAGLHVPATWHASSAMQTTGLVPVQGPRWQVSVVVHALPSLQTVPFGAVGCWQRSLVPSHWSSVHAFASAVHAVAADFLASAGQLTDEPVQLSARSHSPAAGRHTVDVVANPSAGQLFATPSHFSAMSQGPAAARHSVSAVATASAGHAADDPVHCSTASHGPDAARQTTELGWKASDGHDVEAPLQSSSASCRRHEVERRPLVAHSTTLRRTAPRLAFSQP